MQKQKPIQNIIFHKHMCKNLPAFNFCELATLFSLTDGSQRWQVIQGERAMSGVWGQW